MIVTWNEINGNQQEGIRREVLFLSRGGGGWVEGRIKRMMLR